MTSADGKSWSTRVALPFALKRIAYGKSHFFAAGVRNSILVSRDGTTWRTRVLRSMSWKLDVRGAAFGLGRWILISADPKLYLTSRENLNPDACTGTTWLDHKLVGGRHALTAVVFAGNQFLAGGTDSSGRLAFSRSIDGQTWSWAELPGSSPSTSSALAYEAGEWVIHRLTRRGSFKFAWYRMGLTGRARHRLSLSGVAAGSSGLSAVGCEQGMLLLILDSADGQTWRHAKVSCPTPQASLLAVAFGAKAYVAVGSGGCIVSRPERPTSLATAALAPPP